VRCFIEKPPNAKKSFLFDEETGKDLRGILIHGPEKVKGCKMIGFVEILSRICVVDAFCGGIYNKCRR